MTQDKVAFTHRNVIDLFIVYENMKKNWIEWISTWFLCKLRLDISNIENIPIHLIKNIKTYFINLVLSFLWPQPRWVLTKKVLILLVFSESLVTKFVSMKNQKCVVWPTVTELNVDAPLTIYFLLVWAGVMEFLIL